MFSFLSLSLASKSRFPVFMKLLLLVVFCIALAASTPVLSAADITNSFSSLHLGAVSAAASIPGASDGAVDASKSKPTVYLIRHGEKPKNGNGLSAKGVQRAECLKGIFGKNSNYNIGHIMAQRPKKDGHRKRPYDTVKPLADELGLKVDTSCKRGDMDCVKHTIKHYKGKGNILVCWEHERLTQIVKTLGLKHKHHAPKYPSNRFDIIWTDPPGYEKLDDVTYESCPAMYSDDEAADYVEGEEDGDDEEPGHLEF
ncbi:hypothetical protein BROUX41_001413 [Berkeleyomyces rouxiae]|uniref:uncharacterized protein n=1 Tax=Berkeleyomyces rouxiae TaxID=2035830 RepID=UPI003B7DE6B5